MNSQTLLSSRTIASLTNDDSKVLGNIKPKLKRVKERYDLQTNKLKTLNSSWTPLIDKSSNQIIFEERLDLVSNWFDLWNDKQRKWFLLNILSRCRPSQICFLEDAFNNFGIYERKDFTSVLPKYLSIYIFSFLSPKDLSRCAQVSSHWRYLSEQDELWTPKCLKFGWYLPYKPSEREIGAWKAHYVNCVQGINAKPLTKEEAFRYRDTLYRRDLTDNEKEKFIYYTTKRMLDSYEAHDLLSARKPWTPSSQKPDDLKKIDKYLYSAKADPNHPLQNNNLNSFYNTEYGLPKKSFHAHLKTLNKSKSIDNNMLDDFKQSLPNHLLTIKDAYKTMRKSESDLFSTRLTESSFNAYLTYKQNLYQSTSLTQTDQLNLNQDKNKYDLKVIFISSKVPCNSLLIDSLKLKIIPIHYEYEFTNINTLLSLIDKALNGKRAKSIGFFLHFEKPGQIPLTKEKTLYKVNTNDDEISNFFMKLVDRLEDPQTNKFDIFLPLGSSVDGLELVDKLNKITGVTFRVPTGFLYNYKFCKEEKLFKNKILAFNLITKFKVKSKWLNTGYLDSNPVYDYFIEDKLDIWLSYAEILSDAHDRILELVMKGYLPDSNKVAIKKLTGEILYDIISNNEFLFNTNVQNEIRSLISNIAFKNPVNFMLELSNELNNKLNIQDSNDEMNKSQNSSDYILRSNLALKNFIKYKSEAELVEQSMRTQIVLELIKSEINYMKNLEIIQKYYARPLKACLDSGKKIIVSQSVIDMIFMDLTIFYNTSKQIVKDFNSRLKEWNMDSCIGDIMNIFVKNIQSYLNYANNIDSITNTLDKLISSNPLFRDFLLSIDYTVLTNMMSIQELMNSPWSRIKEYMNILGSLQLNTPKNHPDQENINQVLKSIRELYLYIKQMQEKVEARYDMIKIQKKVLNSPNILKPGRHLILEQNGILLNKLTLKFVKEVTCFLFNDGLLIAYRIKQHFAFKKHFEELLVFYDLVDSLYNLEISDVVDSKSLNAIYINSEKYKEYYLAFENFEIKFNFLKSLKTVRKLTIKE